MAPHWKNVKGNHAKICCGANKFVLQWWNNGHTCIQKPPLNVPIFGDPSLFLVGFLAWVTNYDAKFVIWLRLLMPASSPHIIADHWTEFFPIPKGTAAAPFCHFARSLIVEQQFINHTNIRKCTHTSIFMGWFKSLKSHFLPMTNKSAILSAFVFVQDLLHQLKINAILHFNLSLSYSNHKIRGGHYWKLASYGNVNAMCSLNNLQLRGIFHHSTIVKKHNNGLEVSLKCSQYSWREPLFQIFATEF